MSATPPLVFLPGSSGRGDFWDPVRAELTDLQTVALDWPGLGGVPARSSVNGYDDLVTLVRSQLEVPTMLIGQSMGGYVAIRVALSAPELVSHLVLAVTSAGVNMQALGARDWRPGARLARPDDPEWMHAPLPDLTDALPKIDVPVLLLWADRDEISPLSVGERLVELIPNSALVVYRSSDHWVVREHGSDVARRIRHHLTSL